MGALVLFLGAWVVVFLAANLALSRWKPELVARRESRGVLLMATLGLTLVAWLVFVRLVVDPWWDEYRGSDTWREIRGADGAESGETR